MKKTRVSVINGVAKRAALGAMLFSSVAMFATTPNRNTRIENPPQTEVVSKDGTDALKAMTFPQQQNPAVPTVHNKALDEKFLKLADTEEEKQYVNNLISNIYTKNGSYLGSAMVQQNIDVNMFLAFLDGNIEILKRFDEEAYNKIDRDAMQKVVEKGEPIKQWLNENYFNVYNQPFGQFDHMPDAFEVENALTEYIKKNPYNLFEKEDITVFQLKIEDYAKELNKSNLNQTQRFSNMLAYEINQADYLMFFNLLNKVGISVGHKDLAQLKNYHAFIDAVAPVTK